MNKLRTAGQLQDYLDAEFSWRLKEIASLKIAVRQASYLSESTVIRASIALLYAHWEGFVKNAATGYLNFVDCQGLRYAELKNCFVVLGLKKSINILVESRRSHASINALDFVRAQLNERASLKFESAINTEDNLNSAVLENILLAMGFDPTFYESKANLIDKSLLKRRNSIAHGEFLDVAAEEWRDLADEILKIIRQIKTDIENAAALSSYKVPP